MNVVRTQRELAEALGVSLARIGQLRRRDGSPPGRAPYDVDAWREFIHRTAKRRLRKVAPPAGDGAPPAPAPSSSMLPADAAPASPQDAADLLSTSLRFLALTIAQVERAEGAGAYDARALDVGKRALEEARRMKTACLDLAEREGRLVTRDAALMAAAEVARVCVDGFERMASTTASRVEEWLADREWRELSTIDRGVVVRRWVEGHVDALRNAGADELDAMLERARSDT